MGKVQSGDHDQAISQRQCVGPIHVSTAVPSLQHLQSDTTSGSLI